mgnify:CR=1 FL=1
MIQYKVTFSDGQETIFNAPTRAELSNQYKQYAEKYGTNAASVREVGRIQYTYKLIPTGTILTADALYNLYILSYPNREETFDYFIHERKDTISIIA